MEYYVCNKNVIYEEFWWYGKIIMMISMSNRDIIYDYDMIPNI